MTYDAEQTIQANGGIGERSLTGDMERSANFSNLGELPPACEEGEYAVVRDVIEYLTETWRDQPGLDQIAGEIGMEPTRLHKTFKQWAGLTPKAFLQAITLDHARVLLQDSATVLDTAYEVGLSGPSRLHDLFVTHDAVTPGDHRARGEGLTIRYGFHPGPFGTALIMATDRGLAGIGFADPGTEQSSLMDMMMRWPKAKYVQDQSATEYYANRVFNPQEWRADQPLRLVLIGTNFEVRVWQTLLKIPFGQATTYSDVAKHIEKPKAARAVGAAVGRNPISFVVPCHRVLGKSGKLTGYHWGLTRKRAILGWEAGISASA